jgi:hypothetical protein
LTDTVHEKLPLVDGETIVFFEDGGGSIYRARIRRNIGSDDLEVQLTRTN